MRRGAAAAGRPGAARRPGAERSGAAARSGAERSGGPERHTPAGPRQTYGLYYRHPAAGRRVPASARPRARLTAPPQPMGARALLRDPAASCFCETQCFDFCEAKPRGGGDGSLFTTEEREPPGTGRRAPRLPAPLSAGGAGAGAATRTLSASVGWALSHTTHTHHTPHTHTHTHIFSVSERDSQFGQSLTLNPTRDSCVVGSLTYTPSPVPVTGSTRVLGVPAPSLPEPVPASTASSPSPDHVRTREAGPGRAWPGASLARGEPGPGRAWPGASLARGEPGPTDNPTQQAGLPSSPFRLPPSKGIRPISSRNFTNHPPGSCNQSRTDGVLSNPGPGRLSPVSAALCTHHSGTGRTAAWLKGFPALVWEDTLAWEGKSYLPAKLKIFLLLQCPLEMMANGKLQ
ncbi:uncharacterized protein LOC141507309 [Macrotis lagotis]|uniref:uncharacterized protein LOC141507309 n=1 Tax=Macrotis lagotis TaxID=92651 RepID=UPI003D6847D1